MRTGDYAAAAQSNEKAVEYDLAYTRSTGIKPNGGNYHHHDLSFQLAAYSMAGRLGEARSAADESQSLIDIPVYTVLVRFYRWDDILSLPAPGLPKDSPFATLVQARWHFARGLAYAAKGKVRDAQAELD